MIFIPVKNGVQKIDYDVISVLEHPSVTGNAIPPFCKDRRKLITSKRYDIWNRHALYIQRKPWVNYQLFLFRAVSRAEIESPVMRWPNCFISWSSIYPSQCFVLKKPQILLLKKLFNLRSCNEEFRLSSRNTVTILIFYTRIQSGCRLVDGYISYVLACCGLRKELHFCKSLINWFTQLQFSR